MSLIEKISLYFNPKAYIDNGAEIQYSTKRTLDMTDEELQECSELFSTFYGKYSKDSTRSRA